MLFSAFMENKAMKDIIRFMVSTTGQIVRGCLGFALLAWGYSYPSYPANLVIAVIGTIILAAALFNFCLLAPLFGYPVQGKRIIARYGENTGLPGEDVSYKSAVDSYTATDSPIPRGEDNRTGSTTQAGSNYGQGSMHLAGNAYRQGSVKNNGSDYANELDFNEQE